LDRVKSGLPLYAGVTIGFGLISYLAYAGGVRMMTAPLASSACMLFAVPNSPVARAKNVIAGHSLSAAVGVAVRACAGDGWPAAVACVALAIAVMTVTDTVHPPAAATSLLALSSDRGLGSILMPVALGACVIVAAASVAKRLSGISDKK
jgi:CBS-domain-containing membrane protein